MIYGAIRRKVYWKRIFIVTSYANDFQFDVNFEPFVTPRFIINE